MRKDRDRAECDVVILMMMTCYQMSSRCPAFDCVSASPVTRGSQDAGPQAVSKWPHVFASGDQT